MLIFLDCFPFRFARGRNDAGGKYTRDGLDEEGALLAVMPSRWLYGPDPSRSSRQTLPSLRAAVSRAAIHLWVAHQGAVFLGGALIEPRCFFWIASRAVIMTPW